MAENDSTFKGLDTEHSRNSIPPGYYQEFTNVDTTIINEARHCQGFAMVSGLSANTAIPSGYATAIKAQTAQGQIHYAYIGASGDFRIISNPGVAL